MQLKLGIVLKSWRVGDFGKPKASVYRDFDPFSLLNQWAGKRGRLVNSYDVVVK